MLRKKKLYRIDSVESQYNTALHSGTKSVGLTEQNGWNARWYLGFDWECDSAQRCVSVSEVYPWLMITPGLNCSLLKSEPRKKWVQSERLGHTKVPTKWLLHKPCLMTTSVCLPLASVIWTERNWTQWCMRAVTPRQKSKTDCGCGKGREQGGMNEKKKKEIVISLCGGRIIKSSLSSITGYKQT